MTIPHEAARYEDGVVYGNIQTDDGNYGNIWTNIDRATFARLGAARGDTVRIKILRSGQEVISLDVPFVTTFGAVEVGKPLLYLNSLDSVSLAINQQNFAKAYGNRLRARVERPNPALTARFADPYTRIAQYQRGSECHANGFAVGGEGGAWARESRSLRARRHSGQEARPELEEIVVVGTRTAGHDVYESLAPIDLVTNEAIRQSAAIPGEIGAAIQSLVPSFNLPRQSNSNFADVVRPAQLRNLSPDQVLVLVNGKRRHTTATLTTESKLGKGTSPVDFNSIPVGAIERIEVLRDGAGAQYGSDAIAGVINVVLKDADEGGEVQASWGQNRTDFKPTGRSVNDGDTLFASLNGGFGPGDGLPEPDRRVPRPRLDAALRTRSDSP